MILNTISPTFFPTDTLGHPNNCGKNAGKSTDTVAEFASFKGLCRMLSFVHDLQGVRVQIPRIMSFTLKRFARDGLCRYSFNLPQTIRFAPERYTTSPTVLSMQVT